MTMPPLVLVDPPAERFWPLAATRPVAELFAGTRSFLARWTAREGRPAALWCDPAVTGAADPARLRPSCNAWPDPARGCRVALATWIPPAGFRFGDDRAELRAAGTAVAWRLAPEDALALAGTATPAETLVALSTLELPAREAGGRVLDSVWAVMTANPELVAEDAADFSSADTIQGVDPFVLLGEASMLEVGTGVAIGPFVVLDAREGPIVLDAGARVEPHSVLRGPLYLGPGSAILGGVVAGSSIGPGCKIHGDLEQSIVQGYSNKAHEGFVGHSVLGEWVNLGAGTTNSDLKNTYGTVRLDGPGGEIETGLLKVGSFVGDHVKTGIGTLLTTGARIGVGSHVFGGAVSPRWLPHFSWHDGRERTEVRWDAFHRTAETVMSRRGKTMSDGERDLLADLHARSR
jgi:UDP-N-acetylglucosamine diphosphorylase/glucosamine-1-phosphate N-acetyltransferase